MLKINASASLDLVAETPRLEVQESIHNVLFKYDADGDEPILVLDLACFCNKPLMNMAVAYLMKFAAIGDDDQFNQFLNRVFVHYPLKSIQDKHENVFAPLTEDKIAVIKDTHAELGGYQRFNRSAEQRYCYFENAVSHFHNSKAIAFTTYEELMRVQRNFAGLDQVMREVPGTRSRHENALKSYIDYRQKLLADMKQSKENPVCRDFVIDTMEDTTRDIEEVERFIRTNVRSFGKEGQSIAAIEKEIEEEVDALFQPQPKSESKSSTTRVFMKSLGDLSKNEMRKIRDQYSSLKNLELKYQSCPDITAARNRILEQFPHAKAVVDRILAKPARMERTGKLLIKPTLIWGGPGTGKSSLARKIIEELGGKPTIVNVAGLNDDHVFGLSRGWSTGMPSMFVKQVNQQKVINPFFLFDELDKAPHNTKNAELSDRMLVMLEPIEATEWYEPFFQECADVSQFNWLFTANSLENIPNYLLSRLDVIEMPAPDAENVSQIVNSIMQDMIEEEELELEWVPQLTNGEMDAIKTNWVEHRNIRILKKQVESLFNDHFWAKPTAALN